MRPDYEEESPVDFSAPEKPDWRARIFFILFVVIGLGAITYMVVTNKPEKKLICREDAPVSLTHFGNCVPE